MTTDIVLSTAPEDDSTRRDQAGGGKDENASQQSREPRRKPAEIPSMEDCLRAIAHLPGLVATRVLTNAQSNSIRGAYESILRHHERSQQRPSQHASNEDVVKIVREQPELLTLLEPFLTQEQVSIIVREVRA